MVVCCMQVCLCSLIAYSPFCSPVQAKQYKENYAEFEKTARFWTETYAKEPASGECCSHACATLYAPLYVS